MRHNVPSALWIATVVLGCSVQVVQVTAACCSFARRFSCRCWVLLQTCGAHVIPRFARKRESHRSVPASATQSGDGDMDVIVGTSYEKLWLSAGLTVHILLVTDAPGEVALFPPL